MSALSRPYAERAGSEFECYANGLTVEYRDASHRYWLHHDGERIPASSVTTILRVLDKPQLNTWRVNQALAGVDPDEAAKEAADRGTAVHKVLEHWGRDQTVPSLTDFSEDVQGYVQGLCRWLLTEGPRPSSVERFVGSLEHGYAGRLDMRAELHGRDCLVDLKTNRNGRVYDEAHLQARAYAMAEVECGNAAPEGIVIVAVGESGSFEMVECEAEASDWLAIVACHRTVKRIRSAREARLRAAA